MKRDVRIALVVLGSTVGDTAGNLSRMEEWVASAARQDAELVCFPELSATGYHVRDEIREVAEEIPGPASARIAEMAANHGVCVLAGLAEKNSGRIYAAHLLADPKAGISLVYRKLHIGPPEKKQFTPGAQMPSLFDFRGLRLGIQLCYDAHFPELSTRMAIDGADIVFMPHASPGKTAEEKLASWMRHLPARAFDNGVYVAAVNAAGENGCGLCFPGVAVVLSPEGKVRQRYTGGHETMLITDLSAEELRAVRAHPMKYFLPGRRPEFYP